MFQTKIRKTKVNTLHININNGTIHQEDIIIINIYIWNIDIPSFINTIGQKGTDNTDTAVKREVFKARPGYIAPVTE